ncbi:spondin domain-containing protein [Gemmatimonas sp.]|uniref:spondin domain-containing protein n=1 Tax=Gemmatimonas sp. TaxID=1962908 RepID=UPI00286E9C11|nr:spondin domain-containing protein [Gemmatimonas sp.]
MTRLSRVVRLVAATAVALVATSTAQAQQRIVTATVTNLAPRNSISFAPLHVGFHRGIFDSFNIGQAPGAGIISVAEGGSGTQWQADFAAADPTATRGTIGGLLQPGGTASLDFMVNTGLNPFFSFASMVVPSNDFFIGNDSPIRLFDATGNLLINSIFQTTSQIWDAGSEIFDPAAAAFVGNNDLRTPQGSVVAFNFAELEGFNGLTTGAGYEFQSQLAAGQNVYRIDFTSRPVTTVPEPSTLVLLTCGLAGLAWVARRGTRRGA